MLTGAIARAFASEFFKTEVVRSLTGQNYLIGEMIRKYVEKILERDGKLTPFVYIESERKINGLISLSDHSEIRLKGFIDRVDEVLDAIRIIDYKSGSGTTTFSSIESLFNKEEKDRAKRDAGIHVLLDVRPFHREQGKDDTTGHLLRPFPLLRSVRPICLPTATANAAPSSRWRRAASA